MRLTASKMRTEDRMAAEGTRAGVQFVLEDAEFPELERLRAWRNEWTEIFSLKAQGGFKQIALVMSNSDGSLGAVLDFALCITIGG